MYMFRFRMLLAIFLFAAVTQGATASEPERLAPDLINTAKTEINYQIVDGEDLAIFTRAEADYSLGKIYLVKLEHGRPAEIRQIEFSDKRYKDSDPWLSPSGDMLYFISDRPAFVGDERKDSDDYDIWRSRRTGSGWTAPEHLGDVNSHEGEFGPEVSRGYLYFSSRRDGQYDIYRARIQGDGFAKPEKLPAPFNSHKHDSDFTLSKDGRIALWWSTRDEGTGGDLYVSRLTGNGWSQAQNLGPVVNSDWLDFTPDLSPNNAVFHFSTSRPFPGQQEGASDTYAIAVTDVPVLREAISANALARLRDAFGGYDQLSLIKTLGYRLTVDRTSVSTSKQVFLDFERGMIAQREDGQRDFQHFTLTSGGPTSESEASAIGDFLNNFLFYLTADDLRLSGPVDIAGHGDLSWFRLEARGQTSPLVGLDPQTGRITKVLVGDDIVVLELDYLKLSSGIIWPHRFIVQRSDQQLLEGIFSEVEVNSVVPAS